MAYTLSRVDVIGMFGLPRLSAIQKGLRVNIGFSSYMLLP